MMINKKNPTISKLLVTVLGGLILLTTQTGSTWAQEATDSASENVNETTKKLKERIEKIVEEKKEQIKGTIRDLSYPKKGFIGEVQRVSEETITLKNTKGTKIIPIDEELDLLRKGKEISPDEVAVGDWAIVLGWLEDDSFIARRVELFSSSLRPKEHLVMLGSIEEVTSSTQLVFQSRSQTETVILKLTKSTSYQDHQGEEARRSDFEESMQVLMVGYKDEDDSIVNVLRALAPFSPETAN